MGKYVPERLLGSGGMGDVYYAIDVELGRPVALKVLPAELTTDPVRRARLLREARLAAGLSHPHVATVYEVLEHEGTLVLVMEYVEGRTLRQLLHEGPIPLPTLLRAAAHAAEALAAAHRRGVIHRDVKPENLMISTDGELKVVDFGLARGPATDAVAAGSQLPTEADGSLTQPGSVVGTPSYMAPEQIRGQAAGPESDVFALGVTIYEAATGRKPFVGGTSVEIAAAILRDEPPRASISRDGLPADLDRILSRALAKEPHERYRDARDLASDLRELRRSVESSSSNSRSGAVRAPAGRGRRIGGVVAAGVVVLAAAAWWLARDVPPGPTRLRLLFESPGEVATPALSPDGSMIAFVVDEDGRHDLFVARTAGGDRVRLTDDPLVELRPAFSPDGNTIAFARFNPETRLPDLYTIPTLGGPPALVARAASSPAWSPDGGRLAFVRLAPEGQRLVTARPDGSEERPVLRADAGRPFLRRPGFSPDGAVILVERVRGGVASEIWIVPASGGEPRQVLHDPPGVFSREPSFAGDGRSLVHVSNRGGASNLWTVPVEGGAPRQLTSGPGPDDAPWAAKDGRIAFVNVTHRSQMVELELATGATRELARHVSPLWAPAFSPDGREIAFSRAEPDGAWHVWTMPAAGGQPRRLTSGPVPEIYPRFTPDGRRIVFQTWSPGPDRLWSVEVGGGAPEPITPARDDDDAYGDPSPDGAFLAFARTEQGEDALVIAPIAGGDARRVVEGPGTVPRFSPDGGWIAFARDRGYDGGIFLVRPDGTGLRKLTPNGGWPVWWPDGSAVAYQASGPTGDTEIRVAALDGGPSRAIEGIAFEGANNPFDVSRDARRIVAVTSVVTGSQVWMLEAEPGR